MSRVRDFLRQRRRALLAGLRLAAVALVASLLAGLSGELHAYTPSRLLVDRHGTYLGEVPGYDDALGYWPVSDDLPHRIAVATLQTEDRFFHEHAGVHLPSVLRAAWQNLSSLRIVSGASTIAMQVARMQAPGGRSFWRKAREALEALLLVDTQGHQRVLRQYLVIAPYGNRVHGAARAARLYFDKPLEDLSWIQAAFLAGLPQSPGRYSPYQPQGLRRATARAQRILRLLHERGYLSTDELAVGLRADLGLVPPPRRPVEALHAVLALSADAAERSSPILRTTLDLEAQQKVVAVLRDNLRQLRGLGVNDTAALVIDPASGDVIAHVGSQDYFDDDAKGAWDFTRVKRSPGSALKPFIYALAIQQLGWTAATPLPDTPMDFQTERGVAYLPQNMGHGFLGPMLLRTALGNSRNIPALRTLSEVGVERTLRWLQRGGVAGVDYEPEAYGLGLALGNLPVTMEELVGLYAVLANDGAARPLRRFADEPFAEPTRLLDPEPARLVTHILADSVARQPTFPLGGPFEYPYAVAVKTGTSQGSRDAWTVAYSDRLVVAVWVGNHDMRRMNRVTGYTGTAEAAHRIMDLLMPLREPHRSVLAAFSPSEGATQRTICALSGRLAGPHCPHQKAEVFAPGTAPVDPCPFHRDVAIDRRNGLRAGPACPPRYVTRRVLVDLPAEYQPWARAHRMEIAPTRESPLCPSSLLEPSVAVREPRAHTRLLMDPDTPAELSALRLVAEVTPSEEDVVWIVDGQPIAQVAWPHEARWPLAPGTHLISAALPRLGKVSDPVAVSVEQ
ncbi:MAG: transglycosylase domain-containing protein [Deltaproteobacteria bacterium]|nr:transglycosylase domain-containing protein [Deltaproteobacteria bacterium]